MRIRQIALAASDLETTDATFRRLLGCDASYADPEIIYFGLDNRLYTLGDCFLEVVSPVQPNTAAGGPVTAGSSARDAMLGASWRWK